MRSRGAWRLRAPILGVLALLALAGCADGSGAGGGPRASVTSSAPAIPAAAQAKVFVPVATSVTRTTSGSCWTSSITVHAANAYRCYAGHDILDPCFAATAAARAVVCYADPWTPGVRVVLTGTLPRPAPLAVTHPWALELANGKRCVAATGVVNRIGDLVLIYHCDGGGESGLPVARGGATRTEYLAPGARAAVPVLVTVTWQA